MLAVRQLQIALVDAPRLDADTRNPRRSDIAAGRGTIVARDGTPLAITRDGRRVYPLGSITAHAIGYASTRYGTAGLEDAFDRVLAPQTADAGPWAEFQSLLSGRRAAQGAEVVTTLDLDVQRALAGALGARARAAGIVMDPRSGAVIALAATPSFDPNTLDRNWKTLVADTASPLLDRSTSGLYPPGSTFKIVTAGDALEAGLVTPATVFVDTGGLQVGNFVVHNDQNEVTGTQTLTGAFALSSNVDFAGIALKIGPERWFDDATRWGLGAPVNFDLPVARDRLPPRDEVTPSVLAQLGFGQASLLVTPMRMALVAATIADGGRTPRPYLVRSIAGADTTLATASEQLAAPLSPDVANEVRDLMIAVVQHGTGTSAALPGVTVAGKTGTATNPHGPAHSWFVAFAPAQAPRVVVAVIVENAGYGAAIAAPIVRAVLRVALARTRT
ncbi:MAG TPA: penicillin-binding protein 2 [Candidatus Lustribacter sp.]|nr:penicillin-binding protein 2 [Candidatus Lustribacter sp.]